VLIYGHLGLPALGVRGAAFATVIARTLELILYIAVCIRLKPAFIIRPLTLMNVDMKLFGDILKKGLMVLGS
jgi:Na+-driven multidrug efflux pump